jgi:signal transduction histidine kinase
MHAGTRHLSERVLPDGTIIEIRGNPMPGGGFVATFTEVTQFRRAEAALIQSNETLEQRVAARTADLEIAKGAAEHANDAKSRFLAAIGHDLMQPLHAAQLFADALSQQVDTRQRETVSQIRRADSTSDLLTGTARHVALRRAGATTREFALADVLEPAGIGVRRDRRRARLRLRFVGTGRPGRQRPAVCCAACCRTSSPTRCATPRAAASCCACAAMAGVAHRGA